MYSENGFTAQGNPDLKAKAPFVLLLWSTHVRPGRTCSVTIAMHPDRVARRRRMLTEETLRTALEETVQVLERTRRSFKSRELGQLRRRLIELLERLETDEPVKDKD